MTFPLRWPPISKTTTRVARCRPWCRLLLLQVLFGCLANSWASAQPFDATTWSSGTVDLNERWHTHTGDDAAWAQPGWDDHAWETIDLDSLGASKAEWRWFRLHVKLAQQRPHTHLLVVGGAGAYELYLNGQLVQDARLKPWYGERRPVELVVPLADEVSEFTLALRTHPTAAYTLWHLPLFLTVTVGTADAIDNERQAFESQRMYAAVPSLAINLVVILAGLGAFALFASQRARREYLWLALYLLLLGISNGLLYSVTSGVIPLAWNNLLADPLIYVFTVMQIQFTFSFAGQKIGKAWRVYQCALLGTLLVNPLVWLGVLSTAKYVLIETAVILPAALILPILLLVWYRRGNQEAGWLILPSLLPAATAALFDLGSASIFTGWGKLDFLSEPIPLGPVQLQMTDAGDFLFVLAIAVVMFLRFTRVTREQLRVSAELEAARVIQRRLVPEHLPIVRGYALEAAYFPAQEVGGDFYQVLELSDGAQLLVLGDVSGKGLKAAMTSTLALGALRTLAVEALAPAAVLTRLNLQMVENSEGGFITCVCARLESNGALTVASAGHLAPYHNGEELQVNQGLPLGITLQALYADERVRLAPGDRLTLLSDGVVEARDAHGTLFGFERTRALSRDTAASIARAAQEFGQEDDITVVTILRDGAAIA